jgi:4-amino-4-deoxy-L-arabinose transferase-like glycosyltransferase
MRLASSRWFWPVMIVILALVPRLVFWAISDHPGLWDPTEYYSLAVNLHDGRGFTLDYIWSFADHPAAVTHPLDHWLPLPGILAAGSFAVLGVSVQAALLPFVLLGAVQSLLVYAFAGRIGLSRSVQVFAALATAWMPWLFLSSLHTDTTTLFGVLGFGGLAAIVLGMTADGRWLALAGVLIGLAILTRNDGVMLIPAGVSGGLWLRWRRGYAVRWRYVVIAGICVVVVVLPWLIRNQSVLGTPWPGSTARSMFVTDHEDFYAYSKAITLQTYLDQGLIAIAKKILFEMAAAIKLMLTLEESIFPVAILAGLLEMIWRRARSRDDSRPDLAPYVPALCFIILTYGAYTVLMPYLSQGGSFKKAYLAMMPFLLIIGAQAVERHVHPRSAYRAVIAITLVLLLANAVELTRADFKTNNTQLAIFKDVKVTLDELQKTDDREVIVMTRDPWSLNYVTGYRAVMVPNEPLDVILDVADRYGVTYLLAPVPREAINQIDRGEVTNPRFQRVAEFPKYRLHLYRILPAGSQN